MSVRSKGKHSHLEEPNYYRLSYQLAAQRMHAYLDIRANLGGESKASQESDKPAVQVIDAREFLLDAKATAAKLIAEARSMRSSIEHRAAQRTWVWEAGLGPREKRLEHFLSKTVEPSTELLLAGIVLEEGHSEEAEESVDSIRRLVNEAKLPYRTAYNLACYEVAAAEPAKSVRKRAGLVKPPDARKLNTARLDAALSALREALSGVHGRRRVDLGQWARKDPALKVLRECSQACQSKQASDIEQASQQQGQVYSERFEELLSEYGIQEPEEPSIAVLSTSDVVPPAPISAPKP
jgi:hypothetical protein